MSVSSRGVKLASTEGDRSRLPADLGDNFDVKEEEDWAEPNTGYSIHDAGKARNHERCGGVAVLAEGSFVRAGNSRG